MCETSLEDFLDGSKEGGEDEAVDGRKTSEAGTNGERDEREVDGNGNEREVDDDRPESEKPPDGVEPAETTYAWTADGADCTECGSIVERRVRDGDRLVCFDCKVW